MVSSHSIDDELSEVRLKDIWSFEKGFWIICVDALFTYGIVITSVMVGTDTLRDRFGFSQHAASMTIETQFLVSAFLLPALGMVLDKRGRFLQMSIAGGFINLLTHMLMLLLPDCTDGCSIAILPYLIYGVSYSIYLVAIWGALPFIIQEKKNLGTAYGILTCLQNLGTTIMPLLIGFIHD